MKTKHTKGEWVASRMANDYNEFAIYPDQENKSLALVAWRTPEENEANAKLICTAPEMLDKLISLREHLAECLTLSEPLTKSEMQAWFDSIGEVLGKAQGLQE